MNTYSNTTVLNTAENPEVLRLRFHSGRVREVLVAAD
jgi:hypothetical protein